MLEADVGSEPGKVGEELWAQQVSAQDEMERHWSAVQSWLGAMLIERGVERIAAEELTVPPGGDELFSLLRIREHVEAGDFDVDRRRLRPDRRDPAAALVPRGGALVARQAGSGARPSCSRPPGRSPARSSTCGCPTRTC